MGKRIAKIIVNRRTHETELIPTNEQTSTALNRMRVKAWEIKRGLEGLNRVEIIIYESL